MLNKSQIIVLGIFLGLFGLLYFGTDTKPQKHKLIEKSRALNLESTNISNLLMEAKGSLNDDEKDIIHAFEIQLKGAEDDDIKTGIMEKLSAKWYEIGHEAISGFYAEQIAEIKKDESSWSIAGTTFILCIRSAQTDKVKEYCSKRGVQAFENAISINPSEINHKVNLAVCMVENPPKDNPMQGITMLLSLSREHPDNKSVLYQLARFGLQTGQYEKAISRLNKILELDSEYVRANCLLAKIYEEINDSAQAALNREKCINKN
jgi:tetratricopeptide (TPR) repeat protein